jgi:hypothetical protein
MSCMVLVSTTWHTKKAFSLAHLHKANRNIGGCPGNDEALARLGVCVRPGAVQHRLRKYLSRPSAHLNRYWFALAEGPVRGLGDVLWVSPLTLRWVCPEAVAARKLLLVIVGKDAAPVLHDGPVRARQQPHGTAFGRYVVHLCVRACVRPGHRGMHLVSSLESPQTEAGGTRQSGKEAQGGSTFKQHGAAPRAKCRADRAVGWRRSRQL